MIPAPFIPGARTEPEATRAALEPASQTRPQQSSSPRRFTEPSGNYTALPRRPRPYRAASAASTSAHGSLEGVGGLKTNEAYHSKADALLIPEM